MKILLADDHPVVRRGLRQLLQEQSGFDVVAEVSNGPEALAYVTAHGCDLAVLDISMPGMNGLETLKQLRHEHPALPILILSIYPSDQFAIRSFRAGASGYLCKAASPGELVEAVRRVHGGGRYVSPDFAERLVVESPGAPGRLAHERLSDREFQVFRALAAGRTVSEVARQLEISVKTVSTHRANLLRKLGLRTTADLIKYAFEQELD